jgi:hypothetical protein
MCIRGERQEKVPSGKDGTGRGTAVIGITPKEVFTPSGGRCFIHTVTNMS